MKKILFFTAAGAILFSAVRQDLFSEPVDDVKIILIATSDLKGDFQADRFGQGGLAALHSYIETTRKKLQHVNGSVLFLHTGSFTNAKDFTSFKSKIENKNFNLIDYMKYDSMLFKGPDQAFAHSLFGIPVLSENKISKKKNLKIHSKEIAIEDLRIHIFGHSNSSHTMHLSKTIQKQTKNHLNIILSIVDGEKLFQNLVYREDLPEIPEPSQKSFVFQSMGSQDYFIRTHTGSFICNSVSGKICQVEIIFRSGNIISIQQKFLRINDRSIPMNSYPADPKISEFLSSEK
ncbi:MAG: hypothetical protein OEZ34_07040 [Spirochaetia bacterium]|nr:hypothetical protein [Spirochaetia bacterium]